MLRSVLPNHPHRPLPDFWCIPRWSSHGPHPLKEWALRETRYGLMIEIARILCPVDFSECSRWALDHAIAIARWYGSSIAALHVHVADMTPVPTRLGPGVGEPVVLTESERERLTADLGRFVAADRAGGVSIEVAVAAGTAVKEILAKGEEMAADLLVMGTHGRSGFERLVLGSVAEKVLRKATCPVLTVPPSTSGAVPAGPVLFKHILCAVDFSGASLKALNYAMSLAQEADARLTVLHVIEWPASEPVWTESIDLPSLEHTARVSLKAAVPDVVRAYCQVEEDVKMGKAYRQILNVAEERQSDLIVMGVRGRGTADLMFFGSTTQHIVRAATCPVLTLRSD